MTKLQLLKGTPESPLRMSHCSSKEKYALWSSPPHSLGNTNQRTKSLLLNIPQFQDPWDRFQMHICKNIYLLTEGLGWHQHLQCPADNSEQDWLPHNSSLDPPPAPHICKWTSAQRENKFKTVKSCHIAGKMRRMEKSRFPTWNKWVLSRTGQKVRQSSISPWVRGYEGWGCLVVEYMDDWGVSILLFGW